MKYTYAHISCIVCRPNPDMWSSDFGDIMPCDRAAHHIAQSIT